MRTIQEFVDWWNEGQLNKVDPVLLSEASSWFAEQCKKSFEGQYFTNTVSTRPSISLSMLGKPECVLAAALVTQRTQSTHGAQLAWIFNLGDYAEYLIVALMAVQGLEVSDLQKEVTLFGIKGHIDCVVGKRLIDVKSMSTGYFTQFTRKVNDERGYLSQITAYAYAYNMNPAAADSKMYPETPQPCGFICLEKASGRLAFVRYKATERKIKLLQRKVQNILNVQSVEDLSKFKPPRPVPELRYKKPTGNYVIPPSMRYIDSASLWYPLIDGTYVDLEKYNEWYA